MKKERLFYIDLLNCIAILSVLMLHSSQIYRVAPWGSGIQIEGRFLQSLFIPAVFIFFMISGETLISYQERYDTKTFLIKRLRRVGIPFVFWSFAYYLFDTKFTAEPGPYFHPNPGLKDFIASFSNNTINGLFWFFYVIIALYIFTPFLAQMITKHQNYLFFTVVIYFFVNCIMQFSIQLFGLHLDVKQLSLPLMTSSYLGFYIMGYLIKINYFSRLQKNIWKILGLISFIILIATSFLPQVPSLISYSSPFVFFYSIGLYMELHDLLKKLQPTDNTRNFFSKLASTSLGIYILHPILYKIFDFTFDTPLSSQLHIFLMPLLTYLACSIIIMLMHKSKVLSQIIP